MHDSDILAGCCFCLSPHAVVAWANPDATNKGGYHGEPSWRFALPCSEMDALSRQNCVATLQLFHAKFSDSRVQGVRFVDDVRLFVLMPHRFPEAAVDEALHDLFDSIYPPHIILKRDAVDPTIGICVRVCVCVCVRKPGHIGVDIACERLNVRSEAHVTSAFCSELDLLLK